MKRSASIFFLLAIICCAHLNAQELTRVKKHRFSDGIKVGKLHQFKHVFEGDETDLYNFKRFNRTRHTQRAINFSLVGANVLFIVWLDDQRCSNCTYDFTTIFFAGSTIGMTLLGSLANAIIGPIKLERKSKLLHNYDRYIDLTTLEKGPIQIEFGTTPNGIGMLVSF